MKQLPQGQYNFTETEKKILEFWYSKPYFKPEYDPRKDKVLSTEEMKHDDREPWCLICPPPNAYDRPHMGNLSGYPYMDALGRYHRMKGRKVLIFPGKDHAGIEGEVTYVKYFLEPKGINKFDLGREEFYKQVWESQQGFIPQIQRDEKNLGLSADFDRDLYTMDPKVVRMVLETFEKMYKDGLIYKGVRIVNWDPKSRTAISDSQCERTEREGKIYHIKYPLQDDPDTFLTVATTRPETMLGDTALAVNPEDERYTHLIGKYAILPLADRPIPIITSTRVEKDFGTGVLKVTPAHAPDDYEIMLEWNSEVESLERDNPTVFDSNKHHKISYINVIDKNLRMCGPIPEKYLGIKASAAKEEIVKDLQEQDLFIKDEPLMQNILISERSGAVIEPMMSSQWFIDVSPIKDKLLEVLATGGLKIHPKSAEGKYISWVKNLRDWAISRNLWWGYRLPVWYHGELIEKVNEEGQITNYIKQGDQELLLDPQNPDHIRVQLDCPGDGWIQDDDILDTWFSSGQWPYLCLESADLTDLFYPTDVLVSGFDLLVKWDLFMVLFGIYHKAEVPFKNLYLTGLVKGTDGQKMSKSKRNFVPVDDVQTGYGMDAFRMNCYYQNKAGRAYAITPASLKNFRNFNNKIWNASKFVMMNLEGIEKNSWFDELSAIITAEELKRYVSSADQFELTEEDNAMIAKLIYLEKRFDELMQKFRFGILTEELYNEFWHYFCDIYIEQTKGRVWKNAPEPVAASSRAAAQAILFYSLKSFLRMLHPFIPFITEEIWQHLVEDKTPLMYSVSK